jgi:hypothetical protein
MRFATLYAVIVSLQLAACASRAPGANGVSAIGLTPQEWASLSQPGESHKLLQPFVGEWDVHLTFWSSPHSKGQSSKGSSSIEWMLDRRFVREQFRGEIAGKVFEGLGIMGFDGGAREFRSLWIDSLNTAMTVATGRYLPDANAFELSSELYDPLKSGLKVVKSTIRFISPDNYVLSMHDESPEGKSFTSFEMVYSRRP